MATSVVDSGDCLLTISNEGKSIVELCMDQKGTNGMFSSDSAEMGRENQVHCLHPKHLRGETESFLDSVFEHHIVESYSKGWVT